MEEYSGSSHFFIIIYLSVCGSVFTCYGLALCLIFCFLSVFLYCKYVVSIQH